LDCEHIKPQAKGQQNAHDTENRQLFDQIFKSDTLIEATSSMSPKCLSPSKTTTGTFPFQKDATPKQQKTNLPTAYPHT
jgi:hypothetical protein